jgi:hypothetical protein
MYKIFNFYKKELLWKIFGSSIGAMVFAIIYFNLSPSIAKTLIGMVSSFWIVVMFSTMVSLIFLLITTSKKGNSYYYDFILEQKIVPRLMSRYLKEKDKVKKAKYSILIENINLYLANDKKEKLAAKKRIYEIKLAAIPCNEQQKLKIKKSIKEIEIELSNDYSEKLKLSEEINDLEELLH